MGIYMHIWAYNIPIHTQIDIHICIYIYMGHVYVYIYMYVWCPKMTDETIDNVIILLFLSTFKLHISAKDKFK